MEADLSIERLQPSPSRRGRDPPQPLSLAVEPVASVAEAPRAREGDDFTNALVFHKDFTDR
jgi:hypothetical protein